MSKIRRDSYQLGSMKRPLFLKPLPNIAYKALNMETRVTKIRKKKSKSVKIDHDSNFSVGAEPANETTVYLVITLVLIAVLYIWPKIIHTLILPLFVPDFLMPEFLSL